MLRQGDEVVGEYQALGGVLPAHQRLHAGDPVRAGEDLGLVVEHQVILLHGALQLALQGQMPGTVEVQFRLVGRHGLARLARQVECHIALPDQVGDLGGMLGVRRDAHRELRLQAEAIDLERTAYRLHHALGHLARLVLGGVRQQRNELCSIQPCQDA